MANNDYEKELLVPPFNKDDVKEIAKENEYFEEMQVDIYFSDLTISNDIPFITNESKKAKLKKIFEKVRERKFTFGYIGLKTLITGNSLPHCFVGALNWCEDADAEYIYLFEDVYLLGFSYFPSLDAITFKMSGYSNEVIPEVLAAMTTYPYSIKVKVEK